MRSNRSGCLRFLILVGVLLFTLYIFRYEIIFLWNLTHPLLDVLRGKPVGELPSVVEVLRVIGYIVVVVAGAIGLSLLVLFMLSDFILPVRSSDERWKIVEGLYRFAVGTRSPMIFVKEGKLPKGFADKGGRGGAIALVDLNSAIVLEKQWVRRFGGARGNRSSEGMTRVGKPGLVFIRRGEKLRGAVDLRKQFRINTCVLGYTSDGIEVQTNVYAIFALGYPPTMYKISYCGGNSPEHLRILKIDEESRTILAILDELDTQDQEEIHQFAQGYLANGGMGTSLELAEQGKDHPPYQIDEKRVFSAVYSQARSVNENRIDNWTDLPAQVATEVFRDMISRVTYDSLYLPDDPVRFPLQTEFKPAFARTLRHMGVMSYQFIFRLDGSDPIEGQKVDNRQFRISPSQSLTGSRVLRDRGIKILYAGFSELKPTDPAIKQQRLENWRARWQQGADLIRADHDLEVIRMRNRARADRQREMISKLSEILQNSSYSEEALTLRVFQALEDIATDPYTKQLLPRDTFHMLNSMRLWLLPDDQVRSSLLDPRLPPSQNDDNL